MKILFDTSVLVSAFIGRSGMSYEIIDHAIDEHRLYYTPYILKEFKKTFRDKFHYPESLINEFIIFLNNYFIKGKTAKKTEKICRDSTDDQILADAAINKIEIIITGDKDLLVLKKYRQTKIISPKQYWML